MFDKKIRPRRLRLNENIRSMVRENILTVKDLVYPLFVIAGEDIMVAIGGVIPVQDYQHLYDSGAVAIFAPGTNIPEASMKLLNLLIEQAKENEAG